MTTACDSASQSEWHTLDCDGHRLTLPIRYQDPVLIGQGTFGAVIRATDRKTEKSVAIKRMLDPFKSAMHAQRTYRELKLLMYLNHPDAQVVQLYDVFTPERSLKEFQTVYFVFNYAGFNLSRAIQTHRTFAEDHIKLIIYSILRGLKFMHSAGIIHRDIKPDNIGVDTNSNITILDFGLARLASNGIQTGYVSTRWWRAPEILLSWARYDEKVDLWSIGCIMAELILLRPVFRGLDQLDQLNKIFDILGTPHRTILQEICTEDMFNYFIKFPARPRQNLNQLFGFKYDTATQIPTSGVSQQGVDLLDRLLSFDHRRRPTAVEALAHPFFQSLHDPMEEPTIERMVDEYQDAKYDIDTWKLLVLQMMEEFQPPSWTADDVDEDRSDPLDTT